MRLFEGASIDSFGRLFPRSLQNQRPNPIVKAMNATTPMTRPTADAVLRCEVGSEPGPPSGAALLIFTHLPSVHVLSAAHSLSAEHVSIELATGVEVTGELDTSVAVALEVGNAVSSSTRVKSASNEVGMAVGKAVSMSRDADAVGCLRSVVGAVDTRRDVITIVVDIMIKGP